MKLSFWILWHGHFIIFLFGLYTRKKETEIKFKLAESELVKWLIVKKQTKTRGFFSLQLAKTDLCIHVSFEQNRK